MYSNNDWRDYELAHHGILGMKWGKLNGPPYPLDSSDHSASEKKAGWRKSLGGGRNEKLYNRNAFSAKAAGHKALAKIYEINEKTYSKSNKTLSSMNKAAKTEQLKKAEQAQEEANRKRAIKGDDNKKMLKIGAAAVVGAIAVIGSKKLIDINNEVKAEAVQKAFEEAARIQAEQINAWRESSPLNGGPWARANANAAKALRNLGY